MEGAVSGLVYGAVREFARDYPGITFEIAIGGSETQIGALVREDCELSVAFNVPPHPEVTVENSFSDPVCVIAHPSNNLARRRSLRLTDLRGQRVAMLDRTFTTRSLLDSALADSGLTLPATVTINHIGHAIAFASSNMGIAFVPRHIVDEQVKAGVLKAIPLHHATLEGSHTSLCRHRARPLTKPAEAFLRVLQRRFDAIKARRRGRQ